MKTLANMRGVLQAVVNKIPVMAATGRVMKNDRAANSLKGELV